MILKLFNVRFVCPLISVGCDGVALLSRQMNTVRDWSVEGKLFSFRITPRSLNSSCRLKLRCREKC